ncbi:hypothetical protein CDAR_524701 [Caerostris darwini]|uniref:Uncharacterized protein n=1 Tax=Caerostris darwini TaxID=1538125 RepID=A0AAV4QYD4_9ARAC|nr:hypothetical protein CDAR_524701 [Caerostris darwini]
MLGNIHYAVSKRTSKSVNINAINYADATRREKASRFITTREHLQRAVNQTCISPPQRIPLCSQMSVGQSTDSERVEGANLAAHNASRETIRSSAARRTPESSTIPCRNCCLATLRMRGSDERHLLIRILFYFWQIK